MSNKTDTPLAAMVMEMERNCGDLLRQLENSEAIARLATKDVSELAELNGNLTRKVAELERENLTLNEEIEERKRVDAFRDLDMQRVTKSNSTLLKDVTNRDLHIRRLEHDRDGYREAFANAKYELSGLTWSLFLHRIVLIAMTMAVVSMGAAIIGGLAG